MSALIASIMLIGGIMFSGHMHNLYVAGGRVYDDHDGTTSQVSRSTEAAGPLVVAANNRLWACWSEDSTIRRVIYCGYWDEQRQGWLYEFMGSVAGDVTGLYPINADRMVLNVHIADLDTDTCAHGDMWTWVPDGDAWARCGLYVPRWRVYLPGVVR